MTDGEIEFLEPEPAPLDPEHAQPHWRTQLAHAAALVGWTAAAVLAVIAPFRAVYRFSQARQYVDYLPGTGGVDGWGRSSLSDPSRPGVNFGIALVGCAAVFTGLAIRAGVVLFTRRRSTPGRSAQRGAAVAATGAPCLLAGVLTGLGLYVHSVTTPYTGDLGFTSYEPLPSHAASSYSSTLTISGGHSQFTAGGCLWLTLAAFACAALAALAQLRPRPSGSLL